MYSYEYNGYNKSFESMMPFYSSNISSVVGSITDAPMIISQPARLEHPFADTVWQQNTAVLTDGTTMGILPPQGQFIQQLPLTQIDDVRYHPHTMPYYSPAIPVTVATYTGYQQAQQQQSQQATPTQNNFLQSNGSVYQEAQSVTRSSSLNCHNAPLTIATVNGSTIRDYTDASSKSGKFTINGIYNTKENNLVPQPATSTPNSRCSSLQAVDNNNSDTISLSSLIPPPVSKTSAISNNYTDAIRTIGTTSRATNEQNAMPAGYLAQQSSQSQLQNLYSSSGYPSQNAQPVNHRFEKKDVPQYQRKSPPKVSDANFRTEDRTNVNKKLKTIVRKKQMNANANQTQFRQSTPAINYYPQSSNGAQFSTDQRKPQNGQLFYSSTLSPVPPMSSEQFTNQYHKFSQTHIGHQQQQQQMRPDEHHQQMNHQYQQQQFHQQQHIQMQQQQQQQQQQNMLYERSYKQNADYRSDGHSATTADKNLTSSTRNYSTLNSQHRQTYIENYDERNEANNFFAIGHHPRSSPAEGGGYWDASSANAIQLEKSNELKDEERYRESSDDIAKGKTVQNFDSGTIDGNFIGRNNTDENCTTKNKPMMVLQNSSPVESTAKKTKSKKFHDSVLGREKNGSVQVEEPTCDCFPADEIPAEPGSYYTHLGSGASLADLRDDFQRRTGLQNDAIRFEKILYTGKEGKTTQGCPLAKWIIRRTSTNEKILVIVKHRQGHRCSTAWIVVVMVVWEGVPRKDADFLYDLLTDKLNRYGVPTMRRCATNELRTCACQGLDPETNGASFSFGCSWSMYYNGCKYARSKSARKFRLSVRSEEIDVEQRLNDLATYITPIYRKMAPQAFKNMTAFEDEASACRLGRGPGRPFSGVTACVDFCAHSHRDMNNMNNGLTCVVSLSKHRDVSRPHDEQLHVLPLYTIDETDEFCSKENQNNKIKNGSIEILNKYECEMRVRTIPLKPCRRRGKKHEDVIDSIGIVKHRKKPSSRNLPLDRVDSQVQSSQVSSTVLDSPHSSWQPNTIASDSLRSVPLLPPPSFTNFNVSPHTATPSSVAPIPPYSSSNFTNGDLSLSSPASEPLLWNYNDPAFVLRTPESHRSTPYPSMIKSSYSSLSHLQSPSIDSCLTRSFPKPLPSQSNVVRDLNAEFDKYSNNKRTSSFEIISPVPRRSAPGVVNVADPYCKPSESINAPYWPVLHDIVNSHLTGPPVNHLAPTYSIPVPNAFPPSPYLSSLASYPLSSPSFYPYENTPPTFNNYQASNFTSPASPFVSVERPQIRSVMKDNSTKNCSNPNSQVDSLNEINHDTLGSVVGWSSNEECFKDSQIGGVAISLSHGAVLFECAKNELHSTTALKNPNRRHPNRISLVFYQHRNLNLPKHGQVEWEEKIRIRKCSQEPTNPSSNINQFELSSPAADSKFSSAKYDLITGTSSLGAISWTSSPMQSHKNDSMPKQSLTGVS